MKQAEPPPGAASLTGDPSSSTGVDAPLSLRSLRAALQDRTGLRPACVDNPGIGIRLVHRGRPQSR